MEELTYGDLPQFAFQSDSEAPLTIIAQKPGQNMPIIVYADYMDEDAIIKALADIGVSWNYAVFGNSMPEDINTFGIMYSVINEPISLIFFAGFMDMETGKILEWRDNNISPNTERTISPLEYYVVDYIEGDINQPYIKDISKDELAANDNLCTAILYSVPYYAEGELPSNPGDGSAEPTTENKILLLSNLGAVSNLEAIIDQAKVKNPGNTFAYKSHRGHFNFCLKARKDVPFTIENFKTNCAGYVGKFAIEINGEIVPYAFKAEDLPLFFDGSRKAYPIKFVDCNAAPIEIPCEPYVDIVLLNINTTLSGSWSLQYSINDGPRLTYSRLDFPSTSFSDIFRDFIYESLEDYEIDGGGGGLAYFQLSGNRTSIYPGNGSAGGSPVKLTVYKSNEHDDIFDTLFIHEPGVTELSAMSCGLSNFEGY